MARHSLMCRIVMALATRRVCTCGKSKSPTKQQLINRWHRRHERDARKIRP